MAAPGPDTLLLVGTVLRAHGVRGELKVLPETDDLDRFEAFERVYLGAGPEAVQERRVQSARMQQTKRGQIVILALEGVATREDAEALRALGVYVPEADVPPLADDEVFVHDLVGLAVETDAGETVGTVQQVLELPAQNVLVVARPDGPDVLVPAVPAFVVSIDVAGGTLVIRPIEGLLD
jgi:16S rRNA processing protein RimM